LYRRAHNPAAGLLVDLQLGRRLPRVDFKVVKAWNNQIGTFNGARRATLATAALRTAGIVQPPSMWHSFRRGD